MIKPNSPEKKTNAASELNAIQSANAEPTPAICTAISEYSAIGGTFSSVPCAPRPKAAVAGGLSSSP